MPSENLFAGGFENVTLFGVTVASIEPMRNDRVLAGLRPRFVTLRVWAGVMPDRTPPGAGSFEDVRLPVTRSSCLCVTPCRHCTARACEPPPPPEAGSSPENTMGGGRLVPGRGGRGAAGAGIVDRGCARPGPGPGPGPDPGPGPGPGPGPDFSHFPIHVSFVVTVTQYLVGETQLPVS